jgi:hypothetical protein
MLSSHYRRHRRLRSYCHRQRAAYARFTILELAYITFFTSPCYTNKFESTSYNHGDPLSCISLFCLLFKWLCVASYKVKHQPKAPITPGRRCLSETLCMHCKNAAACSPSILMFIFLALSNTIYVMGSFGIILIYALLTRRANICTDCNDNRCTTLRKLAVAYKRQQGRRFTYATGFDFQNAQSLEHDVVMPERKTPVWEIPFETIKLAHFKLLEIIIITIAKLLLLTCGDVHPNPGPCTRPDNTPQTDQSHVEESHIVIADCLRIMNWNIRGIDNKLSRLVTFLTKNDIHIAILIETRWTVNETTQVSTSQLEGYTFHFSSYTGQAAGFAFLNAHLREWGVCLAIIACIAFQQSPLPPTFAARLLQGSITFSGLSNTSLILHCFAVYAPAQYQQKAELWSNLTEHIKKIGVQLH